MKSILSAVALALLAACTSASAGQDAGITASTQATPAPVPEVVSLSQAKPQRILFVGNSYFYYNDSLHNHVQRMAVESGIVGRNDLTYKSATIGGAALRDHAIDHLLQPASHRLEDPFEVVIMQDISSAALSDAGRVLFAETAADYAARVRAAGGEPVLYMTPAYATPHRRYHAGMTADVARLYITTGNAIDAMVIPVGLAFADAYRLKPDIELHKSFDNSHPSLEGTYLAAAVTFASLYRRSPIGNSYDYYGAVDPETARFLQQVAHDTVTAFYGEELAQ